MIEIVEIEGAEVSIVGDYCVLLVFVNEPSNVINFIEQAINYDEIELRHGNFAVH